MLTLDNNHSLTLLATVIMSKYTETVEDTEIVNIFVQFKKERKVKIQIFKLVHGMRFWNKLRQVTLSQNNEKLNNLTVFGSDQNYTFHFPNAVKALSFVEFQFSWNSWFIKTTKYNTKRNAKFRYYVYFVYETTNLGTYE